MELLQKPQALLGPRQKSFGLTGWLGLGKYHILNDYILPSRASDMAGSVTWERTVGLLPGLIPPLKIRTEFSPMRFGCFLKSLGAKGEPARFLAFQLLSRRDQSLYKGHFKNFFMEYGAMPKKAVFSKEFSMVSGNNEISIGKAFSI
ncbi:MAG: hypothetical protein WA228_03655 [Desulfobaccales bacterium]